MAELSPLFVLLTVMRQRWVAGDLEGAVALAKVAAPYLHGRAVPMRELGALSGLSDEQLDGWGSGAVGEATEAPDPGEPD